MTFNESFGLVELDGINDRVKNVLAEANICTVKDIVVRGAVNISEATGIPIDQCNRVYNKAKSKLEQLGIISRPFTTDTYEEETISLGSKSLDSLLGGRGLHTRAVTEFFGEGNSGKTQICHTLCIMVQLDRHQGGLGGMAIYVDTELTFTKERIRSIAEAKRFERSEAMKNILVAQPMSSNEQELCSEKVGSVIDQYKNIKLLVIDSVTGLYRADYIGRANLPQRQQRLYRYMQMLRRISEVYGVAVVVTNQVNQSTEGFTSPFPRPIGGNIMAHSSTYRIRLRQFGPHRIAGLIHSPYLPEKQVWFGISVEGVHDVPEPEPLR